MFPANRYVIRLASAGDSAALDRLAEAHAQPSPSGRTLVGELDGALAAGLSLDDRRVITDPLRHTGPLLAQLRIRAGAIAAYERMPDLRERLLAALSPAARTTAAPAR